MVTIGPYTLRETLGSCQVGRAWLATDSTGTYVTVAVLEPPAASDGQWRAAFAAMVGNLSQPHPGAPTVVGSDFAGPYPWMACALDGGPGAAQVFTALGQPYTPATPANTTPPAVIVGSVVEPATELLSDQSAHTMPVATMPVATMPVATVPPASAPVSTIPDSGTPISGIPMSAAPSQTPASAAAARPAADSALVAFTRPVEAVFDSGDPWAAQSTPAPARPASTWDPVSPAFQPSGPRIEPTAPRPRGRKGLLIGTLVLLVLVVLGGGGAAAYVVTQGSDPKPKPTATADAAPSASAGAAASSKPAGSGPSQPGIEPPRDSDWPTAWPKFESGDKSKSINNLAGLGFSFKVPDGWGCTKKEQANGQTRYVCEGPATGGTKIGGEVLVRTCADPCDSDRRVAMRQQEEAWGAQWMRAGGFATWAETAKAGESPRYGLAFIAYWRSVPDKAIDRQLVFRMTAPTDNADLIRKVANSVRDGIK